MDNFFSPPAFGWLAILAVLFSIFAVLIFALQARKLFLILSAGQKEPSDLKLGTGRKEEEDIDTSKIGPSREQMKAEKEKLDQVKSKLKL